MKTPDQDDPLAEDRWCTECRAQVSSYLQGEGLTHGRIGEWPAWHVAPYVSIWAIESAERPERMGWWVVCGDLPTDYLSADRIEHPRDAMRAFGQRWLEVAGYMERGEPHPTINVGKPEDQAELSPLLRCRAEILLEWSNDDSCWGPEHD